MQTKLVLQWQHSTHTTEQLKLEFNLKHQYQFSSRSQTLNTGSLWTAKSHIPICALQCTRLQCTREFV